MDRVAALPTGTKLVLGAGMLLFLDLFLTWQKLELDFGGGTKVTRGLDGWDFWGLLIGLLTLALLAIVIIRESDSELLLDARWDKAPLTLATIVFAITIVKNLRDAESAWASYLGVLLAGVVLAGALLEWIRNREEEAPSAQTRLQPRPAGPADPARIAPDRRADDPGARW